MYIYHKIILITFACHQRNGNLLEFEVVQNEGALISRSVFRYKQFWTFSLINFHHLVLRLNFKNQRCQQIYRTSTCHIYLSNKDHLCELVAHRKQFV